MAHDLLEERAALSEHESESLRSGMRSDFMLAAIIVALLVAAAAAIWVAFVDNTYPEVRFDGAEAVYDGPETVEPGLVTLTFDARDYSKPVAFMVSELTDDSMTFSDFEQYAEITPADMVPGFVGVFKMKVVPGGEQVERDLILQEGRWLLSVHTSPEDTNTIFPAALLEVKE